MNIKIKILLNHPTAAVRSTMILVSHPYQVNPNPIFSINTYNLKPATVH
jgi:hypothetical protein